MLGTAGLARLPQPSLPSSICIYSCLIPCSQGCHSRARMLSIHTNCSLGVEHQHSDKCIGVMHRFQPVPGGFGVTSCNVRKSGNKNLHKLKFERDLLLGEDSNCVGNASSLFCGICVSTTLMTNDCENLNLNASNAGPASFLFKKPKNQQKPTPRSVRGLDAFSSPTPLLFSLSFFHTLTGIFSPTLPSSLPRTKGPMPGYRPSLLPGPAGPTGTRRERVPRDPGAPRSRAGVESGGADRKSVV